MGDESADLLVEDRFAIVPEWLLDAEIGDAAVRLYAILLRYGNSSGARMPSRSTLARRLHKRSTDSVDRAMKELVAIGAVVVEHRYDGPQRLTNAYHLRTSRPHHEHAPPPPSRRGGRKSAATPMAAARGGRTDTPRVAAETRHNPKHLTDSTTSSPTERGGQRARATTAPEEVATRCGVGDWPQFVAEVHRLRRAVGAPTTRWATRNLVAALRAAVDGRGWPPGRAASALKVVAADPATQSPMRLAEAGPWWDEPTDDDGTEPDELAAMETALLEAGGARIDLQKRARRQLEAEGMPLTRSAVTARAYDLLTADTGAA